MKSLPCLQLFQRAAGRHMMETTLRLCRGLAQLATDCSSGVKTTSLHTSSKEWLAPTTVQTTMMTGKSTTLSFINLKVVLLKNKNCCLLFLTL